MSLLNPFESLFSSPSRRKMVVLASSAGFFGLFTAGMDVILPLWFTQELKGSAAQWAQMRSFRWAGVLAGVVVLGALSDRFGQRVFGALSMFGAAVVAALWAMGQGHGLAWGMPLFGCFISTAFINMNTLTQQVSIRRQGLANSVYRTVGAPAAVAAPLVATLLAGFWHSYEPVVLLLSGLLLIGGGMLFLHPGEEGASSSPFKGLGIRTLWDHYRVSLKERSLMRFIHLSQIWGNVLAGVGTFAAIRYTQELHQTDQRFGLFCSIAGIEAVVLNVGLALFLDKVSLRGIHVVAGVICGICSMIMGMTDSVVWTTVGFLIFGPVAGSLAGPTSMWVSRTAGAGTQTSAFAIHKVFSALYMFGGMMILSWLEKKIGIRLIFLVGGLLGLGLSGLFMKLEDPKHGRMSEEGLRFEG